MNLNYKNRFIYLFIPKCIEAVRFKLDQMVLFLLDGYVTEMMKMDLHGLNLAVPRTFTPLQTLLKVWRTPKKTNIN